MIIKQFLFYSFLYSHNILNNLNSNSNLNGIDYTKNDSVKNIPFKEYFVKINMLKILENNNTCTNKKINLINNHLNSSYIKSFNYSAGGLYKDWNF
jgi:hypothetical protein